MRQHFQLVFRWAILLCAILCVTNINLNKHENTRIQPHSVLTVLVKVPLQLQFNGDVGDACSSQSTRIADVAVDRNHTI